MGLRYVYSLKPVTGPFKPRVCCLCKDPSVAAFSLLQIWFNLPSAYLCQKCAAKLRKRKEA